MAIKIRKKGPRRPDEETSAAALEGERAAEGSEGAGDTPEATDGDDEGKVLDPEVLHAGGSTPNLLAGEQLAEPDRFVQASVGVTGWFQKNWKLVAVVAGVAVTGVIGYMVWDHLRESTRVKQSAALNQAIVANTLPTRADVQQLKDYQQQIRLTYQLRGQPLPPDFDLEQLVPTEFSAVFATADERNEAVLQSAQAVVSQFPDAEVVGEANLVASAAAKRLGRNDEAQALASAAAGKVDAEVEIFVTQIEAATLADAGKTDEAVRKYRSILEAGPKYYGAFALLQIGTLLEQAGQAEKAADAYAELVARFPEAPEVEEGNRRLGLLVDDARARIDKVPVE